MFWLVKTGANFGQSEQTLGLPESANPNNTCSINALQTIVPSGSLIFLARAGFMAFFGKDSEGHLSEQLLITQVRKKTCFFRPTTCSAQAGRGGGDDQMFLCIWRVGFFGLEAQLSYTTVSYTNTKLTEAAKN